MKYPTVTKARESDLWEELQTIRRHKHGFGCKDLEKTGSEMYLHIAP